MKIPGEKTHLRQIRAMRKTTVPACGRPTLLTGIFKRGMGSAMAECENRDSAPDERVSTQRLNAVGWGCFLIWVGISFLANLSWAVVLIGIGTIIVAGQLARYFFRLPVERSWLVIGILLLA